MAKKKAASAKVKKSPRRASRSQPAGSGSDDNPWEALPPVATVIRFDADLHNALQSLAAEVDVSMNQLVQGILRGAVVNSHVGEPKIGKGGAVSVRVGTVEENGQVTRYRDKGCIFFGQTAQDSQPDDKGDVEFDPGRVWFFLDFRNKGVVRFPQP